MSSAFTIPRERWAARSMLLARWLKHPPDDSFVAGDPICEVEIDGRRQIVRFPEDRGDETFWPHHHYVREGCEVGPLGYLLEYSEHGPGIRSIDPDNAPLIRRATYPKVFLSYRRADSEAYAGRLHETLSNAFGDDEVFMDQFSIRPGELYPWVIQQSAAHCEVMIAVIGPRWMGPEFKRKLHDDRDYLHLEIRAALDRGTYLVPVLVERAELPEMADLPTDMWRMTERQVLELSARHWKADTAGLIGVIRRVLETIR